MKKSLAFTLIELLVVIAIIAILAAILFPVFAQAKDAAKKTQTLSNIKQLSLANLMYANDFDDRYPFSSTFDTVGTCAGGWWSGGVSNYQAWTLYVYPYVKTGGHQGDFNASNADGAKAASLFIDPAWANTAPAKDAMGTLDPKAGQTLTDAPLASYQPSVLLMAPNWFIGCPWTDLTGPVTTTSIGSPAQTIALA